MEEKINYSFIIPHKNCPDLLRRCVDSIPQRDDIQIIVVDDNSDEGKKPNLEQNDVEVILLDADRSKGAGRARNVGLEHAKGKWLLFADADDYYTDSLNQILDKYVNDETTDIVYLNASIFDETGTIKPFKTEKLIENYLQNKKNADLFLRFDLWTPWSRMVKKHLVNGNNIRYDELPATNDKMFCLKCSYFAKIVKAEKEVLYMYYRPSSADSITDKQRGPNMLDGLIDVRLRTIELYKKAGYKRIPSFWAIFYKTPYIKGLTKKEIKAKYSNILQVSHTNYFVDKYRFFRNIIVNKFS